jgi:superfamily II RNA helicase
MKTEDGAPAHNDRLAEIAAMTFDKLSDDEVLRLLAERKRLEELQREYEKLQKEEEERLLLEQKHAEKLEEETRKKEALAKAIEKLNQSISPDKADDELLGLIAERKALEKESENRGTDPSRSPSGPSAAEPAEVSTDARKKVLAIRKPGSSQAGNFSAA